MLAIIGILLTYQANLLSAFQAGLAAKTSLVIDIVTFPDARIIQELYLDRLRAGKAAGTSGRLTRFELSVWGEGPPTLRSLRRVAAENAASLGKTASACPLSYRRRPVSTAAMGPGLRRDDR